MRTLRLHDEPIYTLGEVIEVIEKLSWDIGPDRTLLRAVSLRLGAKLGRYPCGVLTALKDSLKSDRYIVRVDHDDYNEEFSIITLVNTAPPLA